MKAVRVHKPGGPEGLVYEDVPDPKAGAGQAVIRVEAIGLNFAEVNARRNANPASLPMPIGGEAAGTVVEVGAGVSQFKVGDRVAFNGVPGAYAEMVAAPAMGHLVSQNGRPVDGCRTLHRKENGGPAPAADGWTGDLA